MNIELAPTLTPPEQQLKVVVPQCNCAELKKSAQSELVQVKTERDVLQITVQHLKQELDQK